MGQYPSSDVTLRLKEHTASSIFTRLSSYAKQHNLYKAMKELGRIYRSLYILKYYDELELRQATEKQLNKVERSHQFARAIFFDNNSEIKQELKEDQDTTILCRVFLQNCIILWNSLQLSQLVLKETDTSQQKEILDIISNGTACSWQHINFHGEYEFNEPQKSSFNQLEIGRAHV